MICSFFLFSVFVFGFDPAVSKPDRLNGRGNLQTVAGEHLENILFGDRFLKDLQNI